MSVKIDLRAHRLHEMGVKDGSLQNDCSVCDPAEHKRLHIDHPGACPGSLDRHLYLDHMGTPIYCVERVVERSSPGRGCKVT